MHRDTKKKYYSYKVVFLTAGYLILFILQHKAMHIVKKTTKSQ